MDPKLAMLDATALNSRRTRCLCPPTSMAWKSASVRASWATSIRFQQLFRSKYCLGSKRGDRQILECVLPAHGLGRLTAEEAARNRARTSCCLLHAAASIRPTMHWSSTSNNSATSQEFISVQASEAVANVNQAAKPEANGHNCGTRSVSREYFAAARLGQLVES